MAGPGRDQIGPMERLTQLLYVLSTAHRRTMGIDRLLDVVHYGAERVEDRRDQLRRDIKQLRGLGWDIDNVGGAGDQACYRLTAVDTRLRVEFTPEERFELLRAARAARLSGAYGDLGDPGHPKAGTTSAGATFDSRPAAETEHLGLLQRAADRHCLVRFDYKGRARVAHPHALHLRTGGWYLTARESDAELVKTFAVARMQQVRIDAPGTAEVPAHPVRPQLDPITWQVDEPVDVVVDTTEEYRPDVEAMLGRPTGPAEPLEDGRLRLTIPVTHRAAFRWRLYELAGRVRLVGPPLICDEVRADLLAVVSGGG